MKRGFLNTEKAKRKLELAGDSNVPQDDVRRDNGKAKAESFSLPDTTSNKTQSHPPLDLHSVPLSVKSSSRHRFIFLYWPRDPKGKIIVPSEIRGKEAGNGLDLWGATLYDFYFVRRIPDNIHLSTISTGSKLTRVMKSFGELEHAADQIALAAREPDPVEIPAWDPAEATVAYERRVCARFSAADKVNTKSVLFEAPVKQSEVDIQQPSTSELNLPNPDAAEVSKVSEDSVNEPSGQHVESVDDAKAHQTPSTASVESPFHPSHYPPPWPVVPFESPSPYPLQRGIPIHLLPKKLYVHDPWKLANTDLDPAAIRESEKQSWSSMSDHVRTYTLWFPPESQEMVEASARKATAAEDKALETPETVYEAPQQVEGPTELPAIRAFLPKRPRKRTEVPEAHLYLSPKGRLGKGHHSVVYEAELELPRDLFCESTYCESCVSEQIKAEVDLLKASGEWERLLEEHAIQKHDSPSPEPSSSSVSMPPRHVGVVKVNAEYQPRETVSLITEEGAADGEADDLHQLLSDPVINRVFSYEGLVVPVYPNVRWQNPSFPDTICKHRAAKMKPVPQTARFRVAAKLSLPDDAHLEREAQNYLTFPSHLFQHWSGYNVVPPIHHPTPVGAVVPQFFGYYKPDTPPDADDDSDFLSPILLIEHCGRPIQVRELSTDDRHECAALLFRFHSAGWLHESFAERNILMQKGHPTCSPLEKTTDPYYRHRRYSFRLIDFGRSTETVDRGSYAAAGEEMMGKKLFGILECEGMA